MGLTPPSPVWTMFKKTAQLARDGFPNTHGKLVCALWIKQDAIWAWPLKPAPWFDLQLPLVITTHDEIFQQFCLRVWVWLSLYSFSNPKMSTWWRPALIRLPHQFVSPNVDKGGQASGCHNGVVARNFQTWHFLEAHRTQVWMSIKLDFWFCSTKWLKPKCNDLFVQCIP